MKILIEEHQYDVARVKDILHGIDALENVEGRVSMWKDGCPFTMWGITTIPC